MTEQLLPRGATLLDVPTRPASAVDAVPSRRKPAVRVLSSFHRAELSAMAVLPDLFVVAAVAVALGSGNVRTRLLYVAAFACFAYLGRVYDDRDSVQTRGVLWYPGLVAAPLVAVAAAVVLSGVATAGRAAGVVAVTAAALTLARALSWILVRELRRRGTAQAQTLLLGPPEQVTPVAQRLLRTCDAGLVPVQLSSYDDLLGGLDRGIEHVVLVAPTAVDLSRAHQLRDADGVAAYVSVVPDLTALFSGPRTLHEVGGLPMIPLGRPGRTRHRMPGKRLLDTALGAVLLVAALPVMAVIAIAIKLDDGGSVLFAQRRTGRGGQTFTILKFRSMVEGADAQRRALAAAAGTDGLLFKLQDDPRVTRVGRLLRRTSLDELPQLWNVLRGDMSLVGPRPLAVEPHEFGPAENERHSVKPGITGSWQLSGGNDLDYLEMVRLDLAYIRSWSLWLDLRLVLRTIPMVWSQPGVR